MKTKQYIILLIYLTVAKGQDECHCLNKTACPNCNSQCDPDWSGSSCHRYNIARNRSAYQSSISLPANLAVDGDNRIDTITRCSRTAENRSTASLTVPFDHPKLIDRIGLYFPNESTNNRGDFQVWIDGKSCYNRSLTDPVTSHIEIACVQQMVGKYVAVLLPVTNRYRVLALCEIEIYECEKQWSGENCDMSCSSCTGDTSVCDQRNQECYNRDVNIAHGETALFIPDPQSLFKTADSVINGNTNGDNCATVFASTPWWEIQFGKSRTISRIKILWSNADVPSIFIIKVDDISGYHQNPPSPLSPLVLFSFSWPSPLRGDRVRIQRRSTEKEQLTLCEVEIFECTDQFYGPDCKHRCNCQGSEYCDKVNGTCFSRTPTTITTIKRTTTMVSTSMVSEIFSSSTSPTSGMIPNVSAEVTATSIEETGNFMKINQSGSVKVFDLIESRFPASIQGDPSVTTDGNTSLAFCVIINGTQPSWKVTFDKQHIIDGLKLYIPHSAELTKFSVQIEGTFCYQRSSSVPIVTPYRFQCFDKLTGDSVTIFVPQDDNMVSLALCEVEIYGKSEIAKTAESNPSENIPVPAILVPCVIAVIIGVVVVIIVVLRYRGYSCVKSKEDTNEPHYAELDRKPRDYYTTLAPPTYQNEPGPNTYENEQIQLEGRNT